MGKYGAVAVRAAVLVREGECASAGDAWIRAAREAFPGKEPSQRKACPKGAFLGLCEDGLVVGVPAGRYGAGAENKSYAIAAVALLRKNPFAAVDGPRELWHRVMAGREKKPNHQMDVVLALWARSLIK